MYTFEKILNISGLSQTYVMFTVLFIRFLSVLLKRPLCIEKCRPQNISKFWQQY